MHVQFGPLLLYKKNIQLLEAVQKRIASRFANNDYSNFIYLFVTYKPHVVRV